MKQFSFMGGLAFPKENGEFEDEYKVKVPSEDEVRIVGNRLRNCQYFLAGINQCRQEQFKNGSDFVACKEVVDSYYYCLSQGQYGNHIEEAPVQNSFTQFQSCVFQKLNPSHFCERYARNGVRDLLHLPGTKIRDTSI